MAKRLLGNLGENTLASWCSQVGIVSTKPDTDMHGWDAILEFPREINPHYTLDHQPAPIECKIQVKSTDNTHRKLSIKLSVLERLIKSPLPAFFLFIEFSGGSDPTNAFLVNLEGKISHDVLKKIRKIDVIKNSNDLNHTTYSISYGNEHELSSLNGLGLQKKIISYIGNDYPKYVKEKANNLEMVGYSGNNLLINLEINSKETLNDFIGMLIGEEKSISQFSSQTIDNRFDIPKKIESINYGEATLQIDKVKPFKENAKVRFSTSSDLLPITYNCDLFLPPPVIDIKSELFKYRLKSPFFEIIVYHNSHKFQATQTIDLMAKFPVNELYKGLRILDILFVSTQKFTISIETTEDNWHNLNIDSPVRSEIQVEMIPKLLKNLDMLINIANEHKVINDIELSINDLFKLNLKIEQLSEIKTSRNMPILAKFNPKDSGDILFNTSLVGIGRVGMIFSGFLFYKIFTSIGIVTRISDELAEFKSTGVTVESERLVYYSKTKSIADLDNHLKKTCDKYESEGKYCLYLFP